MQFILVVWVVSGSYAGFNQSVQFQEFNSKAQCELVAAKINSWKPGAGRHYRNGSVRAECVKK